MTTSPGFTRLVIVPTVMSISPSRTMLICSSGWTWEGNPLWGGNVTKLSDMFSAKTGRKKSPSAIS